jgi:hypothetical protein
MSNKVKTITAFVAFALVGGCISSGAPSTEEPIHVQPTDAPAPAMTLDTASAETASVCPTANGRGTVSPAISIDSITFVVNGLDQVVREGDNLQALPGDQVQVKEVTICASPYSGNGGEVCVDFAPLSQNGEVLQSDNGGTHMVRVTPGFTTLSGPDHTWAIDENWQGISAVVNHWPPDRSTQDVECGGGLCERDDRVLIVFR